ncbi:MAG: hypothetical protein ISEC1_P0408 [Thiomicrorhabdus sp.]|nr:MAG: hypothetical protein ISEC1_P0408 [Thiomicrorhabdus sp.]
MDQKSLLSFIQSRRTCYHFIPKSEVPVLEEEIRTCLQAAISAPNHKLTQPWRFWIASENYNRSLADIYADNRASKKSQDDANVYDYFYQKALDKFSVIPAVILVGQQLAEDDTLRKEDYAACACAIQNFQLMAWSLDIGVQWSTGPIIMDQRTYDLLGITKDKIELIGALYLGHVNEQMKPKNNLKRKILNEVVSLLE